MNILLIEPSHVLASTYKAALQTAGHVVVHTASAQTAIQAIDQNVPQLIILELQLVGHSGIEFLYELRSYPEWQHVPVVIHSLVAEMQLLDQLERLQGLGVVRHLYKPVITLQKLVRAVSELEPTVLAG
jgi:CheY-like chemotaxis protein